MIRVRCRDLHKKQTHRRGVPVVFVTSRIGGKCDHADHNIPAQEPETLLRTHPNHLRRPSRPRHAFSALGRFMVSCELDGLFSSTYWVPI